MGFTIDLDGHVALVTGGGQGVGRQTCLTLAAAGAHVLVNDYVAKRAETVSAEIAVAGGSGEAVPFDVTDYAAVMEAIGERRVDVIVNNAGNAGTSNYEIVPFMKTEPADWDRYLGVNLFGVMNCTRAVLPGMAERLHGRVITIISEAARIGEPSLAAYSAAKAGAAGFTRSIAKDMGRYNVTANNIALATIDTFGMGEQAKTDERMAEQVAKHVKPYLIRRLGQPDDVAGLITFLASSHASWITGQTYPLNGGYAINQ